MSLKASDISSIIKKQIQDFSKKDINFTSEEGQILSVGDGIALVSGLDKAKLGELLDFGNGAYGIVLFTFPPSLIEVCELINATPTASSSRLRTIP